MLTVINWLKDANKFEVEGRGVAFSGPAPFYFDKKKQEDMDRIYKVPWVISHPDAKDRLWRVVGVESWAVAFISQGSPISIIVRLWDET